MTHDGCHLVGDNISAELIESLLWGPNTDDSLVLRSKL